MASRSASSPTTSPRERPTFPPLSRHHSRSSSQIATLASLALSPSSPTSPRLPTRSITTSPRTSIYGASAGNGMMPWSVEDGNGGNGSSTSASQVEAYRENDNNSESDSESEGGNIEGVRSRKLSISTDSTPTTTSSSDHSSSSIPPANRKQMLSERRKTLPAVASPSPLSHLASTASTPSPIPSPDQNPSSSSSSFAPFSPNTQSALASLPPTDPTTPAQTSFPNSSIGLAQLIQQKRRQASAPYYNTARTYQQRFVSTPVTSNENGGFSVLSGGGTGDATSWNGGWGTAAPIPSTSGTISPPLGTVELGQSLPPSRSRSRHGSRRSTTSGRLSLQTSGLHLALGDSLLSPGSMAIGEGDEGMVMTPTTEEWRSLGGKLSELADLRAKDEERLRLKEEERLALWEKEREERQRKEESMVKKKKNPLRPSLWDVSSDEDDKEDDLGLSLSLSRFTTNGKKKRQTSDSSPSTIPIPTPPPPAPPEASPSSSLDNDGMRRPGYQHVPKSSFSYSSTKGGRAGGFVSHSNTSSLSSVSTSLATDEDSLPTISKAPDSEPLPTVETFKPTHRPQKSESSIQLNPTSIARPALSRGSLTSATGGLSSPPIVVNQEDKGSCSPPKGLGLPKIPLPPNVYKSLEQGFSSSSADLGGGTPRSTAPTPSFDRSDQEPLTTPMTEVQTPYEPPFAPPSPARDDLGSIITAVDLDWTKPLGPVDPRTYSAVTGLRNIKSFVVEQEEAGKGAYGSVRRARERGPSGQAVGPELIIKYVIKQRILADCWKKHKILGPIPIEVHVLDHLRRVPYEPRSHLKYLRSIRERRQSIGGRKRVTSGLTRRTSGQPEVDLWRGGEDGGVVRTGHPNVCGLLDFFEDGEFYYLVMPQATASSSPSSTPTNGPVSRGQDLFDFVDLHPDGLSPKPIARILSQVADALAFLHEHSIVHRDIKDENVVLDPEGNVRLIDFGSAAYIKDGRFFDTFSGTLDFAAPEVLKGARYSGKEQDVWALGVLGYVLICGECPFWSPEEAMRGLAADSRALAQLQLKLPDSSLTVGSPTTSPVGSTDEEAPSLADAVDLVIRCLEIDLTSRPSADAICDHAFLAGDGGWRGRRGWIPVESGDDEVLD